MTNVIFVSLSQNIETGVVSPITSKRYKRSKYDLLLTDNAKCAIMGVPLNKKSWVKVELLKYIENIQIWHRIITKVF